MNRNKKDGFHDKVAMPNDHLEVRVRDREGHEVHRYQRIGDGEELHVTHFPVISRELAETSEAKRRNT